MSHTSAIHAESFCPAAAALGGGELPSRCWQIHWSGGDAGSGGGSSGSCGQRVHVVRLVLRLAVAVGIQRTETAIQLVEALDISVEALILGGRKDSEST